MGLAMAKRAGLILSATTPLKDQPDARASKTGQVKAVGGSSDVGGAKTHHRSRRPVALLQRMAVDVQGHRC